MNADQIIKKICHVVVIVFAVKFLFSMGTFDSVTYKGTGYTINFPTGWKTTKEELVDIGVYFVSVEDKDVVTFYPEGFLNPESGQPEVHMTIASGKLASPAWIQDLWPDIVKAIIDSKVRLIDKGEIKINGQISKWVLFLENGNKKWRLEFYVCDEKNGFIKIIYAADQKEFAEYRKVFEDSKETFLFKMGLF
ncbi:MAG: hypothetical protein KKD07_08650 [Candidatus Omnitrophica bacterium]|nr:hypothetical protein [Candidatus Omnitrophota bacterium]MBU1995749.1 hypothetical protein [Candidatus Omnitrophota bacterium]MBU4334494.1 hypothetical protein [Candidatus Omnitrophota bacterium]